MQVAAATGWPSLFPYTLIIDQDTVSEEIVTVTARSGTSLTVIRGADGTSGTAHTAGASVEHGVSARDFEESRQHEDNTENVHGTALGSAVVGTTDAQTLTNKTLTSPAISGATVSGTTTNSGTISGGTVDATTLQQGGVQAVTTTGTQTVSNKTLGSNLAAGGFKVTGLADPTASGDAATKNYTDTGMTSQVVAAAASASAAATSASAAATSASAASTSASAAATSASASEVSRLASEAARDLSLTYSGNSLTYAAAASVSATAASVSASAASVSASNASISADLSLDWATKTDAPVSGSDYGAKYYALEASASSASATVSASAAQASEIAAANSAAAAASSFDSFDDRYLGAKSVAPTVDNDGNPLVVGALFYLDTGTAEQIGMYVYDGAGWVKASAAAVASIVTYEYTASGGQTVFSGADDNSVTMTFTSGLIQVFLNGVLLNPGNDFTTGINTVTLVSGAVSGDSLTVVAFASFNVANTYTQAQIDAALALKSPSASPTFTGTVTLPVTTDYDGTQLSTALDAKLNALSPTATGSFVVTDTGAPADILLRRDSSGGSAVADTETIGFIRIQGWDGSDWNNSAGIDVVVDGSVSAGDVPAKFRFLTQVDGGSYQSRAEISNDGVFYLNNRSLALVSGDWKTTPSQGMARIATGSSTNSGAVGMESGCTTTASRFHIAFSNPNGVVGSISTSSSATAFNTSSDYRLKQDVEPISGALDRLEQLKPVRFAWKADPTIKVDGFLAHEAQAVVPEAVTGVKDEVDDSGNPAYQGIDQSKLVPLLVAAIKELSAEVAVLKEALAPEPVIEP
jgi:hypothetical protein